MALFVADLNFSRCFMIVSLSLLNIASIYYTMAMDYEHRTVAHGMCGESWNEHIYIYIYI